LLGQSTQRDRPTGAPDRAGYDAVGKFGAGALYLPMVKLGFLAFPQNLHAANKPSEHNIANMLPRIVVAQLGGQTQARAFNKTISRTITLRPGNSSLGGT
jgi:hypothetical protein